jgi:hypothetical protein
MTSVETARRYAASSFPEIDEVRLVPPGAPANLVNLSATGMLVASEARLGPGTDLSVEFAGSFTPSSMAGRVIRCEVIGITASGSLRYRIGLAFNTRLALPNEAPKEGRAPAVAAPAASGPAAAPVAVGPPPVLRNRW